MQEPLASGCIKSSWLGRECSFFWNPVGMQQPGLREYSQILLSQAELAVSFLQDQLLSLPPNPWDQPWELREAQPRLLGRVFLQGEGRERGWSSGDQRIPWKTGVWRCQGLFTCALKSLLAEEKLAIVAILDYYLFPFYCLPKQKSLHELRLRALIISSRV